MTDINKLKLFTILFHAFIVIGAGHGIGVLIFQDIVSIQSLTETGFQFNNSGTYEDNLLLVGLLSFLGKIILILSIFLKNKQAKQLNALGALCLLWFSVFLLCYGDWHLNDLHKLAFWSSIPFLISSLILTYMTVKQKQNIKAPLSTP